MSEELCQPTRQYPGMCNTHGSIMHGDVCEAVQIQRVRDVCSDVLVKGVYGESPLARRILSALDGDDGNHLSCIEAPDSPCTSETCDEPICWVCEEPDPSWPCPTRRAQDAEAAIARVREVCEQDSVVADVDGQEFTMVEVCDILRALGDSDEDTIKALDGDQ